MAPAVGEGGDRRGGVVADAGQRAAGRRSRRAPRRRAARRSRPRPRAGAARAAGSRAAPRPGPPRRSARAARSAGVGQRASHCSWTGSTRATGVCWSMNSETITDHGARAGRAPGQLAGVVVVPLAGPGRAASLIAADCSTAPVWRAPTATARPLASVGAMRRLTRGPLPARVYWRRRLVLLGVGLVLVVGIGRLLGGGSDGAVGRPATPAGARSPPTRARARPPRATGRRPGQDDGEHKHEKKAARTRQAASPARRRRARAEPDGPAPTTTSPSRPGRRRRSPAATSPSCSSCGRSARPACTWRVSPDP